MTAVSSDGFSARLWGSIEGIFKQILEHPFIEGLTSGQLDRDAFRYYVVQDSLYLRDYARALAVCGAKSPAEADIRMFCEHAAGAIAVERELHEGFFADFGLTEADIAATEMAPTNTAYTSYLLATVYSRPFEEALGAVLPCYWIYWEVGAALIERGSPDPLYRRWIDTYGGQEFAQVVKAVLAVTDRIGPNLDASTKQRVAERFVTTSRYEWMFWDMGYRQEQWAV
jgi:thiaminase/transcriptional activator TenA